MAQRLGRIRRIIFLYQNVSKCIWYNFRQKPVETGSKRGDFGRKWPVGWYLACGYVVSRLWICCISLWKGGISQNREIVDTPTFPLFGLYMWYLPGKIFFQKANFTVFRWYIVSFVSVCIRVIHTYITYIMVIFFLIILPRRIYNAVFFWRQYVKCIFFKKFWSDVLNVQNVLDPPMNTPLPRHATARSGRPERENVR